MCNAIQLYTIHVHAITYGGKPPKKSNCSNNVISDKDDHYNTCLHLAAKHKHPEALTILLENGANIQAKNNQMLTPLDLACTSNCLKCMEILIEKNAPVNPIGKYDTTPLHQVAQFGGDR